MRGLILMQTWRRSDTGVKSWLGRGAAVKTNTGGRARSGEGDVTERNRRVFLKEKVRYNRKKETFRGCLHEYAFNITKIITFWKFNATTAASQGAGDAKYWNQFPEWCLLKRQLQCRLGNEQKEDSSVTAWRVPYSVSMSANNNKACLNASRMCVVMGLLDSDLLGGCSVLATPEETEDVPAAVCCGVHAVYT